MIKPSSTYASSGRPAHLVRRLHQISTQLFLQRVRDAGFDLTPVQFAALDALGQFPGTDQASLASSIAKDRATIGAVIKRLEQKRLVTRQVDAGDKRARKLSLTREGKAVVATLAPVVDRLQKEIFSGLTEAEYQQFTALAVKAAAAAEA